MPKHTLSLKKATAPTHHWRKTSSTRPTVPAPISRCPTYQGIRDGDDADDDDDHDDGTQTDECKSGLFVYVCMYVRRYVCMYACMYVCAYVRVYVCMHVCVYVCTYICVYGSFYVFWFVYRVLQGFVAVVQGFDTGPLAPKSLKTSVSKGHSSSEL